MLGRSLSCVRVTCAHGLFISWSLEWKSPVDELWNHLNPLSADSIEINVIKD
jgi:hypothetical protein